LRIVFGEADPTLAQRTKVERIVLNPLKKMRLCRLTSLY